MLLKQKKTASYIALYRPFAIERQSYIHDFPKQKMSSSTNAEKDKKDEKVEESMEEENIEEEKEEEEKKELTNEEKLELQVKDLKDQLLRTLADQENTRRIARRDVESASQYAITSFAKSLLDTADNLTRAMGSVPEDILKKSDSLVPRNSLVSLYEGIEMTETGLTKAFEKNGLNKFGSVGETFDPNLHEALYEYADNDKEAGTIGAIMKKGYSLKGRCIRPAEVGVIKNEKKIN